MRTFQIDGKPKILEFTNYDRVPEEELLKAVVNNLRSHPEVTIGEKKAGPSEDYYGCTIAKLPFTLIYDLNYGPSIYSEAPQAIQKLIDSFN